MYFSLILNKIKIGFIYINNCIIPKHSIAMNQKKITYLKSINTFKLFFCA